MRIFLLSSLWLERLLGVLFVVAAAGKAFDLEAFAVQVSYYRVVTDPATVRLIAYGATALEVLLGACLIAGVRLRGLVYPLTALIIVGFTGLVAYAWRYHGIEDCGCFGALMATGPAETIAKNIVMLVVVGIAAAGWRFSRAAGDEPAPGSNAARIRYAVGVASVLIVAGMAVAGGGAAGYEDSEGGRAVAPLDDDAPRTGPYARFVFERGDNTFDLGRGVWLVTLMSADCEHCMATVPAVNDLTLMPETPPVVGLMFGNAQEVDLFRAMTAPLFPTFLLPDQLLFFDLIGAAPPRFVLIAEGEVVSVWDDEPPALDALVSAQTGL